MHSRWKIMLRPRSEQEGGSHYSTWWIVIVDLTVAGWRFLPNAKPPPLHAAAMLLNLQTTLITQSWAQSTADSNLLSAIEPQHLVLTWHERFLAAQIKRTFTRNSVISVPGPCQWDAAELLFYWESPFINGFPSWTLNIMCTIQKKGKLTQKTNAVSIRIRLCENVPKLWNNSNWIGMHWCLGQSSPSVLLFSLIVDTLQTIITFLVAYCIVKEYRKWIFYVCSVHILFKPM